MKGLIYIFLIVSLMTMMTACGDGSFESLEALQAVNKGGIILPPGGGDGNGGDEDDFYLGVECIVPKAPYKIETSVIAFEIKSKYSGSFGFDILNNFLSLFKTKFQAIAGRLHMQMNIFDVGADHAEVAFGHSETKFSKKEFNFELGIKDYGLGFNYYNRTPLARLTEAGLGKTLKDLKGNLQRKSQEWRTYVRGIQEDEDEEYLFLPVGTVTGLQRGDQFAIYNVKKIWESAPCKSPLLFRSRTTDKPIAIGEVDLLLNHSARIRVVKRNYEEKLKLGAEVIVSKLVGEAPRILAENLLIGDILRGEIHVEDGTKVDLTPYLETQIRRIAADQNFVILRPTEDFNY